ncbi:MAG: CD225/dispanin family protein [Propionibacteriaceae bacterium]|nr:CD225/dispanin family protein [Propionibacteriaceae bacterium]
MIVRVVQSRLAYIVILALAVFVGVFAYRESYRVLEIFRQPDISPYWSVAELALWALAGLLAAGGISLGVIVEARLGRERLGLTADRTGDAPKRHQLLALLSAVLGFFPVGIAALAYAVGVETALGYHDFALARRRSRLALGLAVVSFVACLIMWAGLVWFFAGPDSAPILNQ